MARTSVYANGRRLELTIEAEFLAALDAWAARHGLSRSAAVARLTSPDDPAPRAQQLRVALLAAARRGEVPG